MKMFAITPYVVMLRKSNTCFPIILGQFLLFSRILTPAEKILPIIAGLQGGDRDHQKDGLLAVTTRSVRAAASRIIPTMSSGEGTPATLMAS